MIAYMKRIVEYAMRQIGCEIVPKWRMDRLAQTLWLKRFFETAAIDCVFDVGANHGQYAEYLRNEVNYRGWIISFEPVPECLDQLNVLAGRDPKWVVCGYALGRKAGIQAFNVMHESQFSSFLLPVSNADAPNEILAMNKIERVVDVQIRILEDELTCHRHRLGFANPYLKLDTQGYDSEVAAGAGRAIRDFRGLQTELAIVSLYQNVISLDEQILFYRNENFAVGAIFPNNPSHFPEMLEFDCHFVNKEYFEGPASI